MTARASDVATLVGKLLAAFPTRNATEATILVYVEALLDFDVETLSAAVDSLIKRERRLPPVADVREECRGWAASFAPRAIEPPAITAAERRENARRLRELADTIGRRIES